MSDIAVIANAVVVEGLLRKGELLSIYGSTKGIASWAALKLAAAVASGTIFLEKFPCHKGNIALSDSVVPSCDTARQIILMSPELTVDNLVVQCLWHENQRAFWTHVCGMEPGETQLLIVESFDKRFAKNASRLIELLKEHARRLQTAIVVVQSDHEAQTCGTAIRVKSRANSILKIRQINSKTLTVATMAGSWSEIKPFEIKR